MMGINKLTKVSESITINRYDNGWMIEVSGRNKNDNYDRCKLLCTTEEEVLNVVKEYNQKELDI
jgi:hypothetical protein